MAQIYMHANYFARNWPMECCFERAAAYGYDGIEVRAPAEADFAKALADIQRLREKYRLPGLTLAGGPSVVGLDKTARQKAVADFLPKLRIIRDVCGKGQRINGGVGGPSRDGSAGATEEHFQQAAEAYREIGKACVDLGLQFTFEIHMGTLHDTAASTVKLLDLIGCPAITANLDYGNMFLTRHAEKDIPALCGALKGRIGYFHVKN